MFSPLKIKQSEFDLDLNSHKLSDEVLIEFGRLATQVRSNLLVKAQSIEIKRMKDSNNLTEDKLVENIKLKRGLVRKNTKMTL